MKKVIEEPTLKAGGHQQWNTKQQSGDGKRGISHDRTVQLKSKPNVSDQGLAQTLPRNPDKTNVASIKCLEFQLV